MSTLAEKPTMLTLEEDLAGLPRAIRTERLLEAAAASSSEAERGALQERAIEINMPVAAQIAGRYSKRGVPREDLDQVAYLALVKAVRGYVPGRDFMSYAVPTIRGELRRYFRDVGWTIRPPRRIQEAQARITRSEGELCHRLGRAPRPSEIAEYLEMDLDIVVEALSANGLFTPTSLDAASEETETSLSESLGDEDASFLAAEARTMLKPLIPQLTDRERVMLEMRFFQNATQSEIGAAVGITQMQVSRLLSDLMTRLRDQLSPQKEPS